MRPRNYYIEALDRVLAWNLPEECISLPVNAEAALMVGGEFSEI